MGCLASISGCILVVINIIFFLLGLGLGALGGIVKWGSSLFSGQIKTALNSTITQIVSDPQLSNDLSKALDEIFKFISNYGLVFFIIGICFTIIALLAMCGVCCKSKCLLLTYGIIIVLITLAAIAFTVILFVKPDWIKNFGSQQITKMVQDQYQGQSSFNVSNAKFELSGTSGILDIVQITFKCCGVTNYTDFYGASKWNRNILVWAANPVSGQPPITQNLELTAPVSCCQIDISKLNMTGVLACIESHHVLKSNINSPCYTKLWSIIESNWKYVQYGFIGLSVFMAIITILTFCAMRFDDDKVDPL